MKCKSHYGCDKQAIISDKLYDKEPMMSDKLCDECDSIAYAWEIADLCNVCGAHNISIDGKWCSDKCKAYYKSDY